MPSEEAAPPERVARLVTELLDARCPLQYTWSYDSSRADLRALYDKAKAEQWDARTALGWDQQVDPGAQDIPDWTIGIHGTSVWRKLSDENLRELRTHHKSFTFSNFLHGEQGALLATAQLVCTAPWPEAKYYAATQVIDEARHVEAYERYLREKIGLVYPINVHLKTLLDSVLSDSRWDVKYLGMQILIEGLALAAFKFVHSFTTEPLIREIVHMIIKDEARHVAFGVLSLRDYYNHELNEKERLEREELTFEACRLMRDRFIGTEVWTNLGFPVAECNEASKHSEAMRGFRNLLFMRIVPNLKRLGLLTPHLRRRFGELGILSDDHAAA